MCQNNNNNNHRLVPNSGHVLLCKTPTTDAEIRTYVLVVKQKRSSIASRVARGKETTETN